MEVLLYVFASMPFLVQYLRRGERAVDFDGEADGKTVKGKQT